MKNREWLFVISVVGLTFFLNTMGHGNQEKEAFIVNTVEFDLCYEFSVPGKTSRIKFAVALPRSIPGRQKIRIKYSKKPSKVFREKGNRYAEFVFIKPKKRLKLKINIQADLFRYDLYTAQKKLDKNLSKGPNFKDFLKPEKYIEADHPQIQQIAKSITALDEMDTVKSIYNYVIDNMEYEVFNKESLGAVKAGQQKKGDCTEYSDLFVALCRAKNIPARVITGYTTESDNRPEHNWVEAYLKEYGWVPFDPTLGDVKNTAARNIAFNTMRPIHIYFSNTRNDKILCNDHFWVFWRWGDEIKIKDSIKFKQPAGPVSKSAGVF